MWHGLETCDDFRFSSKVWCSMRERNLLCFALLWDEEKCFQSRNLASRECWAEASGSRFEASLWHWELREVSSWRHRHSSVCFSPWFSLARNWWDRFLTTSWSNARSHSVSARHFLQFLMPDWKHFSSRAQWRFLSRMEHQTFDENLKSTEVFNSCHIYCLLFYGVAHTILRVPI